MASWMCAARPERSGELECFIYRRFAPGFLLLLFAFLAPFRLLLGASTNDDDDEERAKRVRLSAIYLILGFFLAPLLACC